MLRWMAWTPPVAVFFGLIVLMLICMTVWEIRSPSVARRGFLPMTTTRGDRLFIGLLSMAFVNLAFVAARSALAWSLGLAQEPSMWISATASLALVVLIMRRG